MTTTVKPTIRFHPHKFAMVLAMAAMFMLFAALTSAYLVQKAKSGWTSTPLPSLFWINTAVILISSVTVHLSVKAFRRLDERKYRMWLGLTFFLGSAFLLLQYFGWKLLPPLGDNDWGNYVLVISGVHAAHILGGLVIMLGIIFLAFFRPFNPNHLVRNQIMATYWHFVDILWLYLFFFFQINLS